MVGCRTESEPAGLGNSGGLSVGPPLLTLSLTSTISLPALPSRPAQTSMSSKTFPDHLPQKIKIASK